MVFNGRASAATGCRSDQKCGERGPGGPGRTQVDSYGSIVALEITQNQQSLNTFNDNFGGGSRWGVFAESTSTSSTFKEGTVVVRLFDTKSKKLLWRASASSTLFSKSEKSIQTLDRGVPKMF
jgi:hypothetical protein